MSDTDDREIGLDAAQVGSNGRSAGPALVGHSPAIIEVMKTLACVAPSQATGPWSHAHLCLDVWDRWPQFFRGRLRVLYEHTREVRYVARPPLGWYGPGRRGNSLNERAALAPPPWHGLCQECKWPTTRLCSARPHSVAGSPSNVWRFAVQAACRR